MIDILIKNSILSETLIEFLAHTFKTSSEKILITSQEELCEMDEIDFSNTNCLCVYNTVTGDAVQLIQLYRYDLPNDLLIPALQSACDKYGVACYIPRELYGSWYLLRDTKEPLVVTQLETASEHCYRFQ